jgi:hypothetical protein
VELEEGVGEGSELLRAREIQKTNTGIRKEGGGTGTTGETRGHSRTAHKTDAYIVELIARGSIEGGVGEYLTARAPTTTSRMRASIRETREGRQSKHTFMEEKANSLLDTVAASLPNISHRCARTGAAGRERERARA